MQKVNGVDHQYLIIVVISQLLQKKVDVLENLKIVIIEVYLHHAVVILIFMEI